MSWEFVCAFWLSDITPHRYQITRIFKLKNLSPSDYVNKYLCLRTRGMCLPNGSLLNFEFVRYTYIPPTAESHNLYGWLNGER